MEKGICPYSLCNDAYIMKKGSVFTNWIFYDQTNFPFCLEDSNFAVNAYSSFNFKTFLNTLYYTNVCKMYDVLP